MALAGGTATLAVNTPASPMSPGLHPLIAVYSGDATYPGSTSAPVTVVIMPGREPPTQIIVTVPAGALTIAVADPTAVTLPDLQLDAAATLYSTSGPIHPVTVTDTRAGDPGWNVSGQVTDFARTPGRGHQRVQPRLDPQRRGPGRDPDGHRRPGRAAGTRHRTRRHAD